MYGLMGISELQSNLLLELEVGQTWLVANHSKRNVRTETATVRSKRRAQRGREVVQSEVVSFCPFAAQPEGSKPGSVW